MSGNKRSKLHHYVPRGLQRHFCVQGEQIWYCEKGNDGRFCEPELRNTESVFKERNYYTVLQGDQPSDKVEREFYGVIDDFLGQSLNDIDAIFANGKTPIIRGETLRTLSNVVFQLIRRTPDFVKQFDEVEIGREVTESTISGLSDKNVAKKELEALKARLASESSLRQIGRHVRVTAQISRSIKIEEELEGFVVRWAEVEGNHSFVLSSIAAYRIGNGGANGFLNPNFEIWLPISPKRALVLLRDDSNRIPLLAKVQRDHMRSINEYAARESNSIASHSVKLLRSLIIGSSAVTAHLEA